VFCSTWKLAATGSRTPADAVSLIAYYELLLLKTDHTPLVVGALMCCRARIAGVVIPRLLL
jgi:hypothetical protein